MKPLAAALLLSCCAMGAVRTVIIDTDAGSDDLMAIAFLLSRSDVEIEAITIVSGVAHVRAGALNVLRLLELSGRKIPVYEGLAATPPGGTAFPEVWRKAADQLAGVDLPQTKRKAESQSAASFYAKRVAITAKPFSILALGPLTNLAPALRKSPIGVTEITIMGGAVRVDGNVVDAGPAYRGNHSAEWNIFADPGAAKKVFASGARIRLIPLDATNKVPIDMAYAADFTGKVNTPLGKVTAQILASSRELMESHIFFAWDPLAAVALVDPAVVKFSPVALSVLPDGRTKELPVAAANLQAALDADSPLFHKVFLAAFTAAQ